MTFTDQLQRDIPVPHWPPRRIISLVPSQTELLAALGLDRQVVGITKFCVHPAEWFQHKTRVGGTKTLNIDKISALRPDLIIGNKEENDQQQIEQLMNRFPVWMSNIITLADALDMIRSVGRLTDTAAAASDIATRIETGFSALPSDHLLPAAYLIWRKPYMAAAADTFIHQMLPFAGCVNVFSQLSRYPVVEPDMLYAAQPRVVLLSSEPYPFQEKHIRELQEYCPGTRIILVNGEMFSWYGSRLLQAPDYFRTLRAEIGNLSKE